jgi:arylsulfatase A-like enzyme
MKSIFRRSFFLVFLFFSAPELLATPRPNLLVIIADDLGGYSDLSAFGSEIHTPHLDGLAREGLVFSSFYVAPTCSPTRAMLYTGADAHLVGLGTMDELRYAAPQAADVPGYEGYLNFDAVTIADVLRDAGYRTYLSGKWHLGYTDDNNPATRGFDRSFALLDGAASHFDQTGIKSDIPKARYRKDGRSTDLPPDFRYSSDFFADRLIGYLGEHDANDRPFFAVLAFTAPHWPLQAPQEEIDRYSGVYEAGWDAIRSRRVENMKRLGLLQDGPVDDGHETGWRRWEDIDVATRAREAKLMQIYAAMVSRLDHNIGRVLNHLAAQGLDRNTYVIFLSDNGPEGSDPRAVRGVGGWVDSDRFDNRAQNMGKVDSFLYLSPEWAHASSTPYRLFKGFPSEGGIRVPLIVRRPAALAAPDDRTVEEVFNVTDLTATLAALGGVERWPSQRGGRTVAAPAGTPIAPILGRPAVAAPDKVVARELFGRKSLRRGDWKILWIEPPKGSGRWELFNVRTDPAEASDLAASEPQRLHELVSLWDQYATRNNVRAGGAGGYGN